MIKLAQKMSMIDSENYPINVHLKNLSSRKNNDPGNIGMKN